MADFIINIKTLADTTGIKLTQQQLEALYVAAARGNKEAAAALSKLQTAQKGTVSGGDDLGFGGAAVGVGTIISLLTAGITKWQAFIEEQNKAEVASMKAIAAMRQEALEVAKIKDIDFSQNMVDSANSAEELQANIGRLTKAMAVLKAEQDALDPLTQSKEWKEYRSEINALGSQLDQTRSKLDKFNQEQLKGLQQKKDAIEAAAGSASPQVKAALANEQAARTARAEGRGRDADMFTKAMEDFKKSMTDQQRIELDRIHSIISGKNQDDKTERAIQDLKSYMQRIWGG